MSYDVYLQAPSGRSVYSGNHTSNTAGMWRAAGCDIAAFHKKPAVLLGYAARCATYRLLTDPESYSHLEPSNGWGSLDSTVQFLSEIAMACEDHPNTTVEVWR